MTQTLLAWLLVTGVLLAAYPWSAWLVARSPRADSRWLPTLLALAVSVGALTLLMFWQSVIGLRFSLWGITLPYLALMLPGWWLWRGRGLVLPPLPASRMEWFMLLLMALVSAAVFVNAVYWPFYRDDTLGIYARYASEMAQTGTLPTFAGRDEAFYQAYPMQLPLAYTYAYMASGWPNDYLARLIPALFSLGCLPAAFVLGKQIYNARAGWLAALLLALAPTFARWASSGYVDLPMAFLYTLAAVFAWRLWMGGAGVDALLAGALLGLAAWTKNAALLGVALLAAWLVYGWLTRRFKLRLVVLALAAAAAVAAPWYLRNWLEVRLIVPPTAWVEQAEPSLANLFVFLTRWENFALTGWALTGGLLAALYSAARQVVRRERPTGQLFLLLWVLPFFLVWWWLVSYDPRFLLLFLPLLAVLAGGWLSALWDRLPRRIWLALAGVALALALYNTWIAVDYKREILQNPLMGDTDKRAIVLQQP